MPVPVPGPPGSGSVLSCGGVRSGPRGAVDGTRPALCLFVLRHAGGSHVLCRPRAGLPDTGEVRLPG